MAKLVLKFENAILKEVSVGQSEVSIGRSPENSIVIDNPAVSNHHARVFYEEGRLMLQDFGSLNGTFVNGQRVKMAQLKSTDSIAIGKHTLYVADSAAHNGTVEYQPPRAAVPKINETVMLDTRERREFLEKVAAVGESAQPSPSRVKIPTLVVRSGSTDRREYALNDKLAVVGKSAMATVKLTGWFKPKAAAQINRRDDNSYYVGAADRVPSVNGAPITHPTKLASGDVIEVAGVELEFVVRD
ncbi:MAG: FHA domain-containing protein [Candidatus Acidiferrales bacterium]